MRPETTSAIEPGILRTDASQRRNIALLVAGVIVFTLLFFAFALPTLTAWVNQGGTAAVLRKFTLVCYSIAALMLIVIACVAGYARRVFRSDQFPPPGTWVFNDTRLRHGAAARKCAWGVVVVAVGCALLAIYTALLPHLLRERLLPQASTDAAPLSSAHT